MFSGYDTIFTKMYNRLKRIRDVIDKALEHIIVYMLAMLVVVISFQVLYRFVIVKFVSFSFPFTEELATFLMIWMTYLAVGICLKEGMHASVNILPERLPAKKKLTLYFIVRILMTAFMLIVIIQGIDLMCQSFIFKSPTLRIPMAYLYLAPVIGSILMIFQVIVDYLGVITEKTIPFEINSGEDI